jgi:hypothetical protein
LLSAPQDTSSGQRGGKYIDAGSKMEKQKFSLLKPVRNQVPTSHTLATLRRCGDEVGGLLLALLLFADRGLVLEVDKAMAPHFGFVNGRQCDALRG